ncbi:MAG: hypothetical protein JWO95_115 [Verrucomicrobiales bacterium]|nr:hypothetical protein [Verrucomicrobiales bacterium]
MCLREVLHFGQDDNGERRDARVVSEVLTIARLSSRAERGISRKHEDILRLYDDESKPGRSLYRRYA